MSFIPGANVGPYRIVEQAERNGVATSYTAYQPSPGRYVSLVVVPAIDRDDVPLVRQYQRQIELVLTIRHPNILTVIDHGEHLGVPFIVTEQIEAESLRERLAAPWPPGEVVRVMHPLADALDYAHGLGVVHGDVRSSAVLLTPEGTPILSGFGLFTRPLAALAGSAASLAGGPLTEPGSHAADADAEIAGAQAADRRGFALIAYELLAGRTVELDAADFDRPLPTAAIGSPLLAAPVEQVLRRELTGASSERYASAAAFVADLEAAQASTAPTVTIGSVSPPPSAPTPSAPPESRRRLITVAAIFVALAVLGTLAILLRGSDAARPIASPAKPAGAEAPIGAGTEATPGSTTTAGAVTGGTPAEAAPAAGSGTSTTAAGASSASAPAGTMPAATSAAVVERGAPAAGATATRSAPSISLVIPSPNVAADRLTPDANASTPAAGAGALPSSGTVITAPPPTAAATGSAPDPDAQAAPTPTVPAAGSTRLPVTWRVSGDPSGRWQLDDQGRVVGRTETGASAVLFPETVEDVNFSAEVSTTSCQATLVFRAQNDENLLMAIYIPDDLPTPGTAGGGVWLYQRVEGLDLPIRAVRPPTVRPAGEPVRLTVITSGQQISILLNDQPALQAVDTATRPGRLGLMVYSTSGRVCEATFGDIQY